MFSSRCEAAVLFRISAHTHTLIVCCDGCTSGLCFSNLWGGGSRWAGTMMGLQIRKHPHSLLLFHHGSLDRQARILGATDLNAGLVWRELCRLFLHCRILWVSYWTIIYAKTVKSCVVVEGLARSCCVHAVALTNVNIKWKRWLWKQFS